MLQFLNKRSIFFFRPIDEGIVVMWRIFVKKIRFVWDEISFAEIGMQFLSVKVQGFILLQQNLLNLWRVSRRSENCDRRQRYSLPEG